MHRTLDFYFPEYMTLGAIFSKMPEAPWVPLNIGLEMDIAYLSSYSGIKYAAKLVRDCTIDNVLDVQKLADILWALFGKNWQKLWDAFNLAYDPLENYNVDDVTERQMTNDRSINKDSVDHGTVDETDTETEVVDYGRKTDTNSEDDLYAYGFNSENKVPTNVTISQATEQLSGSDTTTTNGKSDTTTDNSSTEDTKDNQKENEEIIRTRKGNIGQNTYQELIRQQLDLWKWNFYQQVFDDCDKFLTLSVYGRPCNLVN